jgi:hypothetical protein
MHGALAARSMGYRVAALTPILTAHTAARRALRDGPFDDAGAPASWRGTVRS